MGQKVDFRRVLIHGLFFWRANRPFLSLRGRRSAVAPLARSPPTHPAIAGGFVSAEVIEADSTERKTQS